MFTGSVIWRGIVYTMLMMLGKLICGFWLVRVALPSTRLQLRRRFQSVSMRRIPHFWGASKAPLNPTHNANEKRTANPSGAVVSTADETPLPDRPASAPGHQNQPHPSPSDSTDRSSTPRKPRSLYPAAILGSAMAARGEIGFLISSVAESNRIFASPVSGGDSATPGDSEIFLIVTWAIVLCTVIGPIGVGLLVRRVKRLERDGEAGKSDALGDWGVA